MNGKVLAIGSLIIIIGAFLILKPGQKNNIVQTPVPSVYPDPALIYVSPYMTPESNPNTFELIIEKKVITSGPKTIQVKKRDIVTLNIMSDTDEELHLHGYDKSVDLKKGEKVTLEFTATLTGRFIYELEKSKKELGVIEVSPN